MATTQHQPVRAVEPGTVRQYSLARILGTWAAAALPMVALAWLVAPRLATVLHGPTALPRALILTLLAGLVWQFLLVVLLVYREQRTLHWSVVKNALWLHAPRSPKTGRRGGVLWLVVIPLIAALAVAELLPSLPTPTSRHMGLFLGSDSGQALLSGNWAWLATIVLLQVARWSDATVITTVSSPQKAQLAAAAGADHVIDYTRTDVAAEVRKIVPHGVNSIVEVSPARNAAVDAAAVGMHGTVAVYANNGGDELNLPIRHLMVTNATT